MKDLLLLHGALGSKEQFNELIEKLSAHYKVHTFSFSGHGRVPSHQHAFTIQNFAHEVLDYLNKHQLLKVAVFGYSMGGYVALWLARFYPDRIDKIFTLGTKLKWNQETAEKEIKLLNPEKIIEKVPAFAQGLAGLHGEHEWKSTIAKTALLMKDLAHTHLSDQDFIRIPHAVQLGLGTADNMVTREETEWVQKLLPHGHLLLLENVPHPLDKVDVHLLETEIKKWFK